MSIKRRQKKPDQKNKVNKIESRKNISTKTTYVFILMDWINNKCECICKAWVNKWMNDIRTLSFLSFFSSSSSAIARILYVHMTMCVCERKNGSCYSFRIGSSIRIYAGIHMNIMTHDRKVILLRKRHIYICFIKNRKEKIHLIALLVVLVSNYLTSNYNKPFISIVSTDRQTDSNMVKHHWDSFRTNECFIEIDSEDDVTIDNHILSLEKKLCVCAFPSNHIISTVTFELTLENCS